MTELSGYNGRSATMLVTPSRLINAAVGGGFVMPITYPSKRKPGRGDELPIELTDTQRDRFWSTVDRAGCWHWRGHIQRSSGYGEFWVGQGYLKAHRISWTLERGPIPKGLTVDHVCRNPGCVNPAHLELVSNKVNILRGLSPTAINARKTHCKRGHEFTPENTRRARGRRYCRVCRKDRKSNG